MWSRRKGSGRGWGKQVGAGMMYFEKGVSPLEIGLWFGKRLVVALHGRR